MFSLASNHLPGTAGHPSPRPRFQSLRTQISMPSLCVRCLAAAETLRRHANPFTPGLSPVEKLVPLADLGVGAWKPVPLLSRTLPSGASPRLAPAPGPFATREDGRSVVQGTGTARGEAG